MITITTKSTASTLTLALSILLHWCQGQINKNNLLTLKKRLMNITNMLYSAKAFNDAGNIRSKANMIPQDVKFLSSCLSEELKELNDAVSSHQKLDAYIDMVYFILTNLIALRLGKKLEREYLNVLKIKPQLSLISLSKSLEWSHQAIDKKQLVQYCANYIFEAMRRASNIGNQSSAFTEVHRANMAKFQGNRDLALQGCQLVKEKRNIDCYIERHKGNWIVFGYVDGRKRIFKPWGWIEPDLTPFVYAK